MAGVSGGSHFRPRTSPALHRKIGDGSDVWLNGVDYGDVSERYRVVHWNGAEWQPIPLPFRTPTDQYRPDTIGGNDAHVWATGWPLAGSERLLVRLGPSGIERSAEIQHALGYATWETSLAPASLLAESPTSDRVLFAYAVTSSADTQTCVVGSWAGASAPRAVLLIDSCDSQPGWRNADVHARLFRLTDGTLGVLSPATLTTWSGATTKTRITAAAKTGLLTLQASATTAKHAAFPVHRLQDIVGPGLLHYTPPANPPTSTK